MIYVFSYRSIIPPSELISQLVPVLWWLEGTWMKCFRSFKTARRLAFLRPKAGCLEYLLRCLWALRRQWELWRTLTCSTMPRYQLADSLSSNYSVTKPWLEYLKVSTMINSYIHPGLACLKWAGFRMSDQLSYIRSEKSIILFSWLPSKPMTHFSTSSDSVAPCFLTYTYHKLLISMALPIQL